MIFNFLFHFNNDIFIEYISHLTYNIICTKYLIYLKEMKGGLKSVLRCQTVYISNAKLAG